MVDGTVQGLALFSDTSTQVIDVAQAGFDWDITFIETQDLVKEDIELTATIDDAMVKRLHGRVKIGFNLMALQKEHSRKGGGAGDFTTTVLPELDIDERFARRCISVARLFQNTNRTSLSDSDLFDLPMPMDTWYKLASPSGQTVVKQLESGEIEPTQAAIAQALEEERARLAEEKRRNKELEEEKKNIQSQFDFYKQDAKGREESLNARIDELEDAPTPEVQIVEVLPEEAKARIQKAEEIARKEREWHKKALEDRDKGIAKAREGIERLHEINHDLGKSYQEASEELRVTGAERMASVNQTRIRQDWRKAVDLIQIHIDEFMRKVPNLIDKEVFESDDWSRYVQCIYVIEHAANSLKQQMAANREEKFVDGSIIDAE